MVAVGILAGSAAGVGSFNVILSYIGTGCAFTLLAALTFAFFEFAKLARARADKPVPIVLALLRQRAPLAVLPTLLWPLMLAAYTTAKMAIPFIVGYSWDGFWADADRLIFGQDAWILSIPLVDWAPVRLWEWLYSAAWGVFLFVWFAAVPFYASKRSVGVMYTAAFGAWLLGGWLLAYATSAAGPVFAHLVDPALADRIRASGSRLVFTADITYRKGRDVPLKGIVDEAIGDRRLDIQYEAYASAKRRGPDFVERPLVAAPDGLVKKVDWCQPW